MKKGSLTIGKGKSRLQLFYSQLAPNIFFIDENILLVVLKTKLGTGSTALPVKSKSFRYDADTMRQIKKIFAALYEEQQNSQKQIGRRRNPGS